MTARVTTLKGPDAGAYYVEALPNYYLDSGEPRGVWHGRGAEMLGLTGEVVNSEFLDVMAGLAPSSRGRTQLGRAYGDKSVRGFDITASAPKSVSVLFAVGDDVTRNHVLAAHDNAVEAMLGWVEDHAHTRYRIMGEVVVVDAEGIIAATFRQHTSRSLDPQLHTHVVIANKVRSPDGRWLALDARSIKLDQRTLSAIYHATLRSELTGRLGVAWQQVDNGIAEIDNIPPEVLHEFSARTDGVRRRIDEKIDRFINTFDRDPTPRERWRLEREAVIDSRPAKTKNVDAAQLHAEWIERLGDLDREPAALVADAVGRVTPRTLDSQILDRVIDQAIEELSGKQSTWRPAEITREIAAALPTDIALPPDKLTRLLEQLTAAAIELRCTDLSRPIPDGMPVRRDGRPITESVADRALTTPQILEQENALLGWAERRLAVDAIASESAADRSVVELTGPQAATAGAIAGDGALVMVVGPAGTGKTTALAPAVEQLRSDGRPVFGVAPSAAAAEVLGTETGVDADTIDKLIHEYTTRKSADREISLSVGTTVIVDEAGMVSTEKLSALAFLADNQGWRVALIGDPLQFSAVGRGGMFAHLLDTHGGIELDRVHRFTNDWERAASLRIRRGDPTVAEEYDRHGRLHDGTATRMETEAVDAWWQARQRGETVLLAAPSRETAGRLNARAQQARINAGQINPDGPAIRTAHGTILIGDEIVTRRNHRKIRTDRGMMIRNRDRWTVTRIHPDGTLTATGRSGTVRLPAAYVTDDVELGYAQTSHASQGRTVDRSILVLDGQTDVRGVYVPMTRGRHANDAYIVTDGERTAVDIFADAITHNWIDQPAIARYDELYSRVKRWPGTLTGAQLRDLFTQQERQRAKVDEAMSSQTTIGGDAALLKAELGDIDQRLDADRRVRHGRVRNEPPGHVTEMFGTRPSEPTVAKEWDAKATDYDQRHAAYGEYQEDAEERWLYPNSELARSYRRESLRSVPAGASQGTAPKVEPEPDGSDLGLG